MNDAMKRAALSLMILALASPATAQNNASSIAADALRGAGVIAKPSVKFSAARVQPLQRAKIMLASPDSTAVADMTGWTRLSDGAPKGGASIVDVAGGQSRIIIRGADDGLYMAAFTPGKVEMIDSNTWQLLEAKAYSEPYCVDSSESGQGATQIAAVACSWLGSSGNVLVGIIKDDAIKTYDIGFFKGKGHPTLSEVDLSTNDGKKWTRAVSALTQAGETTFVTKANLSSGGADKKDWVAMPIAFGAALSCDRGYCAGVKGNRVSIVADFGTNSFSPITDAPPLPGGKLSGVVAQATIWNDQYKVVVVDSSGRVFSNSYKGSAWKTWQNEGGALKSGSGLSCLIRGAQLICYGQGQDGRLYWTRLGNSSGM